MIRHLLDPPNRNNIQQLRNLFNDKKIVYQGGKIMKLKRFWIEIMQKNGGNKNQFFSVKVILHLSKSLYQTSV